MAVINVPAPRLPEPTQEYSLPYMQDLLRALEIFIEQEKILKNNEKNYFYPLLDAGVIEVVARPATKLALAIPASTGIPPIFS